MAQDLNNHSTERTFGERLLRTALYQDVYQYDRLENGQIRIILLKPSTDPDHEIHVEILYLFLEDSFEFNELSYSREKIPKCTMFLSTDPMSSRC
jgi:hypothetical protein